MTKIFDIKGKSLALREGIPYKMAIKMELDNEQTMMTLLQYLTVEEETSDDLMMGDFAAFSVGDQFQAFLSMLLGGK